MRTAKIEKVMNEIAGVKKGKPMTFDEADTGKVNPHYVPHTATADNCQSCIRLLKLGWTDLTFKRKLLMSQMKLWSSFLKIHLWLGLTRRRVRFLNI